MEFLVVRMQNSKKRERNSIVDIDKNQTMKDMSPPLGACFASLTERQKTAILSSRNSIVKKSNKAKLTKLQTSRFKNSLRAKLKPELVLAREETPPPAGNIINKYPPMAMEKRYSSATSFLYQRLFRNSVFTEVEVEDSVPKSC